MRIVFGISLLQHLLLCYHISTETESINGTAHLYKGVKKNAKFFYSITIFGEVIEQTLDLIGARADIT